MSKFPATFFKKAIAADALIDPQSPNICQLSLIADDTNVYIYHVSREVLTQLAHRIEQLLIDVPISARK
jgi:hypothetical protein